MKKLILLVLIFIVAGLPALALSSALVFDGQSYFAISYDGSCALVRCDGENAYLSLQSQAISSLVVFNDKLYFLQETHGVWYLSEKTDQGAEKIMRFDGVPECLAVYDGNLLALIDGELNIIYPDMLLAIKLSSTKMESFVVYDDSAYFISKDERADYELESTIGKATCSKGILCRINLTTCKIEPVTDCGADEIMLAGDDLIYRSFDDIYPESENGAPAIGAKRRRMNLTTGETTLVSDSYDWGCCVCNNKVYLRREGGLYLNDELVYELNDSEEVYSDGTSLIFVDMNGFVVKIVKQ